jgi:hypothetical protein
MKNLFQSILISISIASPVSAQCIVDNGFSLAQVGEGERIIVKKCNGKPSYDQNCAIKATNYYDIDVSRCVGIAHPPLDGEGTPPTMSFAQCRSKVQQIYAKRLQQCDKCSGSKVIQRNDLNR